MYNFYPRPSFSSAPSTRQNIVEGCWNHPYEIGKHFDAICPLIWRRFKSPGASNLFKTSCYQSKDIIKWNKTFINWPSAVLCRQTLLSWLATETTTEPDSFSSLSVPKVFIFICNVNTVNLDRLSLVFLSSCSETKDHFLGILVFRWRWPSAHTLPDFETRFQ